MSHEMPPRRATQDRLARLAGAERTMIRVRWFGVVFALVQVFTYTSEAGEPSPPLAFALVTVLAAGNLAVQLALAAQRDHQRVRMISGMALALDFFVVMGFVAAYTFDPLTAMWAVVYILPLEGAIKFQRTGALATMAAATVAYTFRELNGSAIYGYEFLPESVSFRMGIGFIIAGVAGAISSGLLRERDRVELLYATSRAMASSLDVPQVLAGLARSAAESLQGSFAAVLRPGAGGVEVATTHGAPSRFMDLMTSSSRDSPEDWPSRIAQTQGRPVWSGDIGSPESAFGPGHPLVAVARECGFRSLVATPVSEPGRKEPSVLVVYFADVRSESREDEDFLVGLSDAAAIPLAHAAAYGSEHEAAEELRKLQELRTRFLAMVAHDLRAPLTVIKALSETLRRSIGRVDPGDLARLLGSVEAQADRLNDMVGDILDLARLEVDRLDMAPQTLRLRAELEDALADLPGAEEVAVNVDPEIEVVADPRKLSRIVVNLVSNALRHGEPPVEILGRANGSAVAVEVADHGPGLPHDRADLGFEPFMPGHSEDSVGLGLAIVRGFVEAQGGELKYVPNEPKGARFVFTLPAPNGSRAQTTARPAVR